MMAVIDDKTQTSALQKKRQELQMGLLLLAMPIPGIITTVRHLLRKRRQRRGK